MTSEEQVDILWDHIQLLHRVEELTEALRRARNAHPGYLEEHWEAHYKFIDDVLGDEADYV